MGVRFLVSQVTLYTPAARPSPSLGCSTSLGNSQCIFFDTLWSPRHHADEPSFDYRLTCSRNRGLKTHVDPVSPRVSRFEGSNLEIALNHISMQGGHAVGKIVTKIRFTMERVHADSLLECSRGCVFRIYFEFGPLGDVRRRKEGNEMDKNERKRSCEHVVDVINVFTTRECVVKLLLMDQIGEIVSPPPFGREGGCW